MESCIKGPTTECSASCFHEKEYVLHVYDVHVLFMFLASWWSCDTQNTESAGQECNQFTGCRWLIPFIPCAASIHSEWLPGLSESSACQTWVSDRLLIRRRLNIKWLRVEIADSLQINFNVSYFSEDLTFIADFYCTLVVSNILFDTRARSLVNLKFLSHICLDLFYNCFANHESRVHSFPLQSYQHQDEDHSQTSKRSSWPVTSVRFRTLSLVHRI